MAMKTGDEGPLIMLLRELGEAMGLSNLAFDEASSCTLLFDERIPVRLVHMVETDTLVLLSDLGSVDPGNPTEAFRRLCEANLFGRETGGAILGLEDDFKTVVLRYSTPASELDYRTFETLLEELVNVAEFWQARLVSFREENREATEPVGMPSGLDLGMRA